MNANTENTNIVLDDIKTALISEMISYEFYSHSSISANLISVMHAFQDMMQEEEKHVNWLKKEYEKLGGTEKIEYDHCEYGGIALPMLDIDLVTALDVAMKEESSSIKMYNDFFDRHKDSTSGKLFETLLGDEKKHVENWEAIYKDVLGYDTIGNNPGNEVYRFTKEDIEIIKAALQAEKKAFAFYNNAVNSVNEIDGMHAFQHMAWEEEMHVKKLESEYYRLIKQKPEVEGNPEQTSNIKNDSDALFALDLAIKEEKNSLQRYLDLEGRCVNSKLKEVIWEMIESEWEHINQWRRTHKAIKEKGEGLMRV